jgi:hypothetical protein
MRRFPVLLAVIVLAGCGSSPSPVPSSSPTSSGPTQTPVTTTVTCDGTTDTTGALQAAVDGGGSVKILAGTCVLSGRITVKHAVTIAGAGSTATFLVQHAATNIFQITAAGVTVEDMNLNTATFNPGAPILKHPKPSVLFSNSSNTSVRNVTAEAGSGFGMRLTGPNPCSSDTITGDVVDHVSMTNTGVGGFASIDIDCQQHGVVSNVIVHGAIIALFEDSFTSLTNETYTPGPNGITCEAPWYITGPSHDMTVANVVSMGGPGIVKPPTSNITLTNQTVKGLGC